MSEVGWRSILHSKPHVITGVDQISRMSALFSSRGSLLPLAVTYPGDKGGGIACLLRPFCSEAQIKCSLHPRKPGKHDKCLKGCLPTTSYPSKEEMVNTGGNIPKIPEASSKVRLSICSNYWIYKLNDNIASLLARTHCHGCT